MNQLHIEQIVRDLKKAGDEVLKSCQNLQLIVNNKGQYQNDDYQETFDQTFKEVEEKTDSFIKLNNSIIAEYVARTAI